MDVAAFADDNFNEKEWINKIFKSPEAQDNRDVFVSSLVKRLQVYVQQVNHALEDTSTKVLQSLPRVVRDTEILHQEALLLRDKMLAVKKEIAKAEQDTGQSMSTLEKVDRVKTELQAAKQALNEADNWTILANDLEERFEKCDLEGIAERLVGMQQSLQILAHVPDYEDKRLQLEGLKNRLEAMASPQLVQAFTSANVDQSRRLVYVFERVGRLPQLLQYHHKCQEKALLTKWRDLAELEADETAAECLRRVYDALLASWTEQTRWCNQVFAPTPVLTILLPLFADLLVALEPALSACVGSTLNLEDPLSALTDLRQVTKHFSASLQTAVESQLQSDTDSDVVLALAQGVQAPWVVAVQRYGELERPGLVSSLSQLDIADSEDTVESEQLEDKVLSLTQAAGRVCEVASASATRCSKLTQNCGTAGLIEAIQAYVNGFVEKYKSVLHILSQKQGEKEDWKLFQMCLTMLQGAGELMSQLEQLESILAEHLLELSTHLSTQDISPFLQHDELLLTPEGRTHLHHLITLAQHGETGHLLEGSFKLATQLCCDAHKIALDVICTPILAQLKSVPGAQAWKQAGVSADLPDFSFTPQEYITQVGQYLMTLPQHMEPFLLRENPGVGVALRTAEGESAEVGGAAELLLGAVAKACCQALSDQVLAIEYISNSGAKQLATDINYLGNVLEDLGLSLSETLQHVCQLLRLSPDEYQTGSTGCSARLVATVRHMRNLSSIS